MKFGYLWFSLLGCLPMGVYAQEGISKDSIRLSEDSLKTIPGWQNISPDFSPSYAGTKGVEVDNLMDTLKVNTNVEWKLQKPFFCLPIIRIRLRCFMGIIRQADGFLLTSTAAVRRVPCRDLGESTRLLSSFVMR